MISPDGHTKNQIDHVLIDKNHKGCINNVRSYRDADSDSDHYLLITQFKLRLTFRWSRKNSEIKQFDIGKLKNKKRSQKIRTFNSEQISTKHRHTRRNEIKNQWSRVTQAIKECATDVVGWTEKTKRKDWINDKF